MWKVEVSFPPPATVITPCWQQEQPSLALTQQVWLSLILRASEKPWVSSAITNCYQWILPIFLTGYESYSDPRNSLPKWFLCVTLCTHLSQLSPAEITTFIQLLLCYWEMKVKQQQLYSPLFQGSDAAAGHTLWNTATSVFHLFPFRLFFSPFTSC